MKVDIMKKPTYKQVQRIAQEAVATRETTRTMLDLLIPDAIYFVFEAGAIVIHQTEHIKATPKRYKVRLFGKAYTLPREPLDAGEQVSSGPQRRQFVFGRAIQAQLQQQLVKQIKHAAHAAQLRRAAYQKDNTQ